MSWASEKTKDIWRQMAHDYEVKWIFASDDKQKQSYAKMAAHFWRNVAESDASCKGQCVVAKTFCFRHSAVDSIELKM